MAKPLTSVGFYCLTCFIIFSADCWQVVDGKFSGQVQINQVSMQVVQVYEYGRDLVFHVFHYSKVCTVDGYKNVMDFIRNISFRVVMEKMTSVIVQVYRSLLSYLVSLFHYIYLNYIRKYHQVNDRNSEKNLEYYYWIAYCVIVTSILSSIFILIAYNIYKVAKRRYDLRKETKSKEEKLRQQRITTLYEILVSERQYCEYLKFLHDQYYLPLEKGDSSKQMELNATTNLLQSIKETVAKNTDLNKIVNSQTKVDDEEVRNIVDFISVHNYKKSECLLIPPELENIIMLNNRLLTSLESEILGWHTKDRLMYNIYRYSVKVIGNIFRKSELNDVEQSPSTPTDQAPQTPTVLTKKPLPSIPGVSEKIDNFGYNIKSVREKCNILENCFKEYMQAFIMYAMFICKYNECRTNINEVSKEFPLFGEQLKKARSLKGSNSLDLMSFIVMVPQRLPRYVLFLKQLGKFTNLHDPQFKEIEAAIKEIEKITFKVNSFVKDYQNQSQVITLKDTIINLVPSFKSMESEFVQPFRRAVGAFKMAPIRSKEDQQGGDHTDSSQTPRTQHQTVEVHVFTDLTIVITSKPKIIPTKAKEDKGFFGFFTPRNKDKRNSLQTDPSLEELIYEVYYCDNTQISMFSQSHNSDCIILELGKSKYFTNVVEEKSNHKEKKNSTPSNINNKSKLIHLDKNDEHTKNFIQTFEKLSGQNKNMVFTIVEEGLWSNSKVLTLMASYIND